VADAALHFAPPSQRNLEAGMDSIQIKSLTTLDEMQAAVALQKTYWGNDLESVIPAHMLFSLATYGGHVLAAVDSNRVIGVLVGFLGTLAEDSERPAMANLQMVSKRMVVLPEYRGSGVGYRLKLTQRDLTIRQGVRLVTWTFDPLMALNAHLNIRKLGAISHRYLEDYYGTSNEGGLTTLGSSDRLQAEWWVTNHRVEERINKTRPDLSLPQYLDANTPILNTTTADIHGTPWPAENIVDPTGLFALAEIPVQFSAIVSSDPVLARAWRLHSRELFKRLLPLGYIVTDFLRTSYEGRERAFYLFSRAGTQFEHANFSRN
jgi:predicted GNAT superfamily acetyltransferase